MIAVDQLIHLIGIVNKFYLLIQNLINRRGLTT